MLHVEHIMIKTLLIITALAFIPSAHATYIKKADTVNVITQSGDNIFSISINGIVKFALQKAGTVTFTWDANSEDVDGYYLYCSGTADIKEQTTGPTVSMELTPGQYKCWATAYKGDEESAPSNVISVRMEP